MPYLTPESLSGSSYGILTVPDDTLFRAAVWGVLTELIHPQNWETYGTVTAEDAAAAAAEMVDNLSFGATAPGGSFVPSFSHVQANAATSISGNTKIPFGVVVSDPDGLWSVANQRFEIINDGYYLLYANVQVSNTPRGVYLYAYTTPGGYQGIGRADGDNLGAGCNGTLPLVLSAGDFVEIYAAATGATTLAYAGPPPAEARLLQVG